MIRLARPVLEVEERAAVDRVLRSGMLAQGPEVAAFEEAFAAYVDVEHAVAVNSGTSGLHLGLLAAGVGPGDDVIVPSFTFAATANAVALAGATPVFVDIEPGFLTLDPAAVRDAVTPRTVGMIPVHLFGHPCDLTELHRVARDHDLFILEDAAQAHGATWSGRRVGSGSLAGVFSFYPTKNMTTGEGGMITTSDDEVARRCRLLRNQGMSRRYDNEIIGFNLRMTDIAAAIGRVQLGRLPGWTASRRANARDFDQRLRRVEVPPVRAGAGPVYHQYTIQSDQRDDLRERLRLAGVESAVYYPTPVHRLPPFARPAHLPVTEDATRRVLSLPVHPFLSDEARTRIVRAVNA